LDNLQLFHVSHVLGAQIGAPKPIDGLMMELKVSVSVSLSKPHVEFLTALIIPSCLFIFITDSAACLFPVLCVSHQTHKSLGFLLSGIGIPSIET
jgi:hypothetical protein